MTGDRVQMVLDDGAEAVVTRSGITVQFNAGGITLNIEGNTIIVDNKGRVEMQTVANDAAKPTAAPRIGDLDNGGVYVGPSAEDGRPLHAALSDEPEYLTYNEALAAAERLKSEHPTAHVPTPLELNQLYVNKDRGHLRDTFHTSGLCPASVYRSSASHNINYARVQWFDIGNQSLASRYDRLPVRLVW